MVGWDHRLNGHESEQTPGGGEGQGSLALCSPWALEELDTTELITTTMTTRNPEQRVTGTRTALLILLV